MSVDELLALVAAAAEGGVECTELAARVLPRGLLLVRFVASGMARLGVRGEVDEVASGSRADGLCR
jgi:hypothetical protein